MFHVKHLFLQSNLKNDILYSKFDATIKKYNWKFLRHFYNISPLSISALELKIRIHVSLVIINKICKLHSY